MPGNLNSAQHCSNNQKQRFYRQLLLSGILLALTSLGYGATITSNAVTGNWNATTSWVGSTVPASGDSVIIAAGANITVTANASCLAININATNSIISATLSVNTGVTLSITNGITVTDGSKNVTLTLAGAGAITCSYVMIGKTTTVPSGSSINSFTITSTINSITLSGGLYLNGTATSTSSKVNNPTFDFQSGTLTVGGSVTSTSTGSISGTGPTVTLTTANGAQSGTLILSGATPFNLASLRITNTITLNGTSATVNYSNAGAQTVYGTTYNNLILSGSGAKITTGATVNGKLSMQGTATTTGTVASYGAASTLEYKGSAAQTTGTEFPATWSGTGGILIDNASGVTLNAAKNIGANPLTIGGAITNSILADGGFQLTGTGTLTLTSGIFKLGATTATTYPAFATSTLSAGTTVEYAATVAQTVSATPSYQNLTFSGAGAKTTASGTLTIGGNWSVTGGTATLNTNNTTITLTGNLTGSGAVTSGSGTINIAGNWTNSGTFTANTGTVNYNNTTGGQTVAGFTYNVLTLSNTSGTQTAAAAISTGTLNTTSGGTFNMVTFALTATTVSHAGILQTQNTSSTPITTGKTWGGTVQFNSSSAQTIVNGNYTNLDGTGGNRTLNSTGTIGIAGTFTKGSGTYTITGSAVDFNGSGNQTIPAFTFNNLTVSNGGTKSILASTTVTCQTLTIGTGAVIDVNSTGGASLVVLQ